MDSNIKKAWIDALRSGEYKQDREALSNRSWDDERGVFSEEKVAYCCLGVLCDIVAPEKWEVDDCSRERFHDGAESYPSRSVLELAGLRYKTALSLANLNDTENYSFEQIADYIEKRIKG